MPPPMLKRGRPKSGRRTCDNTLWSKPNTDRSMPWYAWLFPWISVFIVDPGKTVTIKCYND